MPPMQMRKEAGLAAWKTVRGVEWPSSVSTCGCVGGREYMLRNLTW